MDDNSDNGTEKLFLLEFLVDYVTIQRTESMMKGMDNDQCVWFRSPTCVAFQFLNYPPLEICQDDFSTKKCAQDGKSMFKNGKSCLFAIPGTELCQSSPTFAVDVTVHKKLPPECLPGQVLVGNATIQLADIFNGLVLLIKNTPECVPVSKTLKDSFVLTNQSGNAVGEIKVFIRLSCFGKLIVTQFELGGGNKPFLFKGSEGSGVYECQKVDSQDKCGVTSAMQPNMRPCPPQNPCIPSQPCPPCAPSPPCPPCPPCQPAPPCQQFSPPCAQYQTSSPRPPGPPCPPCAISPDRPWSDVFGYGDKNMNQASVCCPSVCSDKDKYEEIGAEVNGHALKIRVPKKKKKKSTCGPCAPCAAPPADPCGPCSPCADTAQMLPPPTPPCGSCAPCGNPSDYGARSSEMDACGPCAPCGNPPAYGNSYGAQSSAMDTCGPCSPCGNPSSYGGQSSTMDACGPCGIPSNYGNSYGAQNMSMDACGPCAPCGSPSPYGNYGTQNMATTSCAPCTPTAASYASQGTAAKGCGMCGPSFGGQNSAGEPCSSCPACIQPNQQNQLIFNHPCAPGKVPESSVFYKVTACPEECTPGAGGGCKKTIKIEPQIQCGGKVQEQQQDCNRDVFVLRIGKKGDGPDHKSNLELELRTPKCPPLGPCGQSGAPEADASKPPKDKGKGGKKDKGKGKGKKGKKKK